MSNTITTTHPYYRAYNGSWVDCRNAFLGQQAVKDAGVRYLPALSGQTPAEYEAYKMRALFYSITGKTVSALVGMALDQTPELKYPDKMAPYFEDHAGTQFYEALSMSVQEILLMGRFGILVDRPAGGGKPYFTLYSTEHITNWRTSDAGDLEMVVLREYYLEQDESDNLLIEVRTRYRKLELVGGKLEITVYKTAGGATDYAASPSTTITNTGVDMDYIPFFCATPMGLNINPEKPPMQDIVDINFSHYRTSADLEHGRHFTGLPTPYVVGAESQAKMHIGSTSAWVIPDASAKVGFLEFTGQGLQSLEKALAEKQSQLASMSARMIDNSTRGSEAAETVRLRYLSETSSLRSIVRSAQGLLNAAYGCMADMEGLDKTSVNIVLNTNFLDTKLSAAEIKAWVEAYLSGAISKEIYLHNLKVGRALPPPGESVGTIPDPPPIVNPNEKPEPTPRTAPVTTPE